MKKLLDMGFKKIKTEPGFHMYELTPARLPAASDARSVDTANKRASKRTSKLDK